MFSIKMDLSALTHDLFKLVQTSNIDGISTRIHSGPAKNMNPAVTAKVMAGSFWPKLVIAELFLPHGDSERIILNRDMDDSFLSTYRTVTNMHLIVSSSDFEGHCPTMTTALICRHSLSLYLKLKLLVEQSTSSPIYALLCFRKSRKYEEQPWKPRRKIPSASRSQSSG